MNKIDLFADLESLEKDKDTPDKLKNITRDSEGILEIPEGFQYCKDCDLITPHKKEHKNSWMTYCVICDNSNHGCGCPNCGWEVPDDDGQQFGYTFMKKIHDFDCDHYDQKEYQEYDNKDCDCEEVQVYAVGHAFNYNEQSVMSFDCYNAMEWWYDIRCPICSSIFDIGDGNC